MKRLEAFRIYYNQTIHPELMRMEIRRKRLIRLLGFSILAFIGIIIFELYINILALTLLVMIPIGIYISWLLYQVQRFRQNFKPNVVNLILDFLDDDINYGELTYDNTKGVPSSIFLKSQFFRGQRLVYSSEDYIKGSIGNFDFEMSEVLVQEVSPIGGKVSSLFKGVFVKSAFDFELTGAMLILPISRRHLLTKTMKSFVNIGGINYNDKLLDAPFREAFTTFTTDPEEVPDEDIEAGVKHVSYVLAEDVQKAIANYYVPKGNQLYISFVGKQIYILLEDENDFLEPYLFRSNVSFDLVKDFFEDIQLIMSIIEEFDKFY